ncbi:MAG: signal recognition particle protein [Myxococcales bacterium]|nr:signal recognition particle protein [Myxococcales bacterium]
MFDNLQDKLGKVFKNLRGHGKLTEANIQDALRDVRLSLLEADVNFRVVKKFLQQVQDRALGTEVMGSLTPGQVFVKIVHEELVGLMGEKASELQLGGKPPVPVMFVGLQGSGKTTTVGKTAMLLRKKGRRPLLVPADVYRPAAITQLKTLAAQIDMPVFDSNTGMDPVDICLKAYRQAELGGQDILLIDTAGRLQVDEPMMAELERIKSTISPAEILFVADAMTGQDAVNVAQTFNERLTITGVVLTKMDGDARGGAALSIKAVTQKPIKLVGVGEKMDAIEVFHPDRMASRILDMGDILTLVERAESTISEKEAAKLEEKLRKNQFNLEDFRDQLKQLAKMGSFESLLSMLPGMGQLKALKGMQLDDSELKRTIAIIDSMTAEERRNHMIINGQRRLRIAKGSGTSIQDINGLLKRYVQAKKMIGTMAKSGGKMFGGMMPSGAGGGKSGPAGKKVKKGKKGKKPVVSFPFR